MATNVGLFAEFSSKILKWKLLVHYLEADKEGSRLRRSVEIARIAEFPFIQVFLETVEDILYTRIQLKLDMVVKHKGVVQLHIQVQELGVCSMRSEVILQKAPSGASSGA